MALIPRKETSMTNVIDAAAHTILGPESNFSGKLVFDGQVRIDGRFSGEIETKDIVVIAKSGHVEANLHVGVLKLHGTLRGNVYAEKAVELHPPAKLYGDIFTPQLMINPGVIFEGNCKMENLDKVKMTEKNRPEILKNQNQQHKKN